MAPRRRRLPSFFKILLDRSAPELQLPPRFVRKHLENKIPEDPILRSVNGGYSWRLKIKKVGEHYCFADGWSNVVEDSELGFGDFLLFWLVDPTTFKLSIFSPNGCERDFPPQIQDYQEEVAVKAEEQEEEEQQHQQEQEEQEEEEEHQQEQEEEVENDDDDDDDDDDDEDEDEGEEEVEDDEEEESDGEVEEEEDVDYEEEEEEEDDDDGGGDIDGDDGDPFFMTTISKGHTSSMRLPLRFAQLAGIDEERSIKLKDLDGKEWAMSLLSEKKNYTRYYLSAGWTEFKRVNELCEGDKCLIKFLRNEDMLCLAKVTKNRLPAKQPPVKASATEVNKRATEVPPRVEVEINDNTEVPPCVEMESKDNGEAPPCVEVESKDNGEVPPRVVVESKDSGEVPPRVVVQSKDSGAEVVKKRGRAKQPAGEAPVAKVLKRTREQPPRGKAPVNEVLQRTRKQPPRGKAPATEVKRRTRGPPPPPRVEVESKEEKKRGSARRSPEKAPAMVSTRSRGRPPHAEVVEEKVESIKPADKAPVAEVSRRTRGRPPRMAVAEEKGRSVKPAGEASVAEVVKRRRRGASSVEVESKDDGGKEEVRRPRGRPFTKKRGRPAAHAK